MNADLADVARRLTRARVFVTGATGFLGSHLTSALVAAGADVHALVRPAHTARLPPHIVAHEGDLVDRDAVARAVRTAHPRIVFHLAAYGTTPLQVDAERMRAVNLGGTRNVWDAVEGLECRVIATGTCAEYGAVPGAIPEDADCSPVTPYAASVHDAVRHSLIRAADTGIPTTVVRPFGPYGPSDRPERLIPYVVERLLSDATVDVTAGDQLRDYSYVDDQVRALLLAATTEPRSVAAVYNIGSGQPIRVRSLLELVAQTVAPDALKRIAFGARPYRADDAPEMYADVTAARRDLGYSPAIGLEEGIRRTVAWYRAHLPAANHRL